MSVFSLFMKQLGAHGRDAFSAVFSFQRKNERKYECVEPVAAL